MAVKYVKDFEFSPDRGFHKSAEPMKAKASYRDMPARAKPNAAAMGAKKMESAPGRANYAAGGRTSYADMPYAARVAKSRAESDARTAELRKKQDTSFGGKPNEKVQAMRARLDAKIAANRQASDAKEAARRAAAIAARKAPSGPTRSLRPAPTMTIMPVPYTEEVPYTKKPMMPVPYTEERMMPSKPEMMAKKGGKVEKVMREYKEGKLHSGSKKGPVVKDRKQAVAIALSEARKSGAKMPKKAEGGIFSTEYMASKGPKTRGTPRKGREMGRKDRMDRMALEKMRKAEKYAPGLSIDMPDRKAHGGMPKSRKMMYGGGKC